MCIILICGTAGCKKSESKATSQKSMGRFVEQEIMFPSDLVAYNLSLIKNAEGKLEAYGYNQAASALVGYVYENGEWEKKEASWLSKLSLETEYMKRIFLGKDGCYYALMMESDENGRTKLYKSLDESEAVLVPIKAFEQEKKYMEGLVMCPDIWDIQVAEDGSLIVSDSLEDYLDIYDASSFEPAGEIEAGMPFCVDNDHVYAGNQSGDAILTYGIKDNKQTEENIDFSIDSAVIARQEDTTYLACKDGIFRKEDAGSMWQNIVDGNLTSLATPNNTLSQLAVAGNGDLYVMANDGQLVSHLFRYYYDETVASVPSQELTIYSLLESPTIRQAISKFQKENPDVRVNYLAAMGGGWTVIWQMSYVH